MGISRRQDRAGRNAGSGADPRIARGVGYFGKTGLPGALHLCVAQLRSVPSFDAALPVQALGRHSASPRTFRHQMGQAARPHRQPGRVSHAGRRFAVAADVARSAVNDFIADAAGATAIEYGLLAALISVAILAGISTLGGQMQAMYVSISQAMP